MMSSVSKVTFKTFNMDFMFSSACMAAHPLDTMSGNIMVSKGSKVAFWW